MKKHLIILFLFIFTLVNIYSFQGKPTVKSYSLKINNTSETISDVDSNEVDNNNKNGEAATSNDVFINYEDAPDVNSLYSKACVLIDGESHRILFGKNEKDIMPMASTTKIMTLILALESGKCNEYATFSSYAASMPEVDLGAKEGETYILNDLLYSLILESHNDTAVAIAEKVGGSVEGFALLMNEKAKELGLENTYYITPNGLDASISTTDDDGKPITKVHSTSAYDLARVMSYCILESPCKEEFIEISRTQSYTFTNYVSEDGISYHPGNIVRGANNHNAFLGMMDGVIAGKTGFTGDAGYCYVGALMNGDRYYIVALLACGWPNNKSYKWSDTKKLMNYGIDKFHKENILDYKPDINDEIMIYNGVTKSINEIAYSKVYINEDSSPSICNTVLLHEGEKIETDTSIKKSMEAPVYSGDKVGDISYHIGNYIIKTDRIEIAPPGVEKRDFSWYFKYIP